MAGHVPNWALKLMSRATAVGVSVSPWPGKGRIGMPCSNSITAGAGTGRTPWAHRTCPSATGRGLTTKMSGDSLQNSSQVRQISRMLSRAPTSWKWISSGFFSCTLASALASRVKVSTASSLASAAKPLFWMSAVMSERVRCSCWWGNKTRTPHPPTWLTCFCTRVSVPDSSGVIDASTGSSSVADRPVMRSIPARNISPDSPEWDRMVKTFPLPEQGCLCSPWWWLWVPGFFLKSLFWVIIRSPPLLRRRPHHNHCQYSWRPRPGRSWTACWKGPRSRRLPHRIPPKWARQRSVWASVPPWRWPGPHPVLPRWLPHQRR